MKTFLWNLITGTLAKLPLPGKLLRYPGHVLLSALARREPKKAMKELLLAQADLEGLINQVALPYDGGVHVKHRLMDYHSFFVERIAKGESVLDIGCGYGAVAHSIATRAGARVTGIDIDPANIAKARATFNHDHLTFIEGDALVDLPDKSFDTIVLSNVLEHIDDRIGFLKMAQARIHPHRWLIRVPMADRHWTVPLKEELGLPHYSDVTHFIEYTRSTFDDEISRAGLTVAHLQVNWGEIWAEIVPAPVS